MFGAGRTRNAEHAKIRCQYCDSFSLTSSATTLLKRVPRLSVAARLYQFLNTPTWVELCEAIDRESTISAATISNNPSISNRESILFHLLRSLGRWLHSSALDRPQNSTRNGHTTQWLSNISSIMANQIRRLDRSTNSFPAHTQRARRLHKHQRRKSTRRNSKRREG